MDKVIEKPKWPRKKVATAVVSVLALALIGWALVTSGVQTLRVDRNTLSIAQVEQKVFQENIPITGTIEPKKSFFITAAEGGNVEEIFVEDGALVEQGQPLMRLSNANLMLDFMNRETQIIEQINNLRNTRLNLEQNKRVMNNDLIDLDYRLLEAKRQYALDSGLFKSGAISTAEHAASKNNISYLRKKRNFVATNIEREEAVQSGQIRRIDASISLMERNLEAIRRNLENLTIKAPSAGQLTGFNHFLGEAKQKGEALGQVAVLEGFHLRCQVDEYYLNRVAKGQKGTYSLGTETKELVVTKILPQVVNGQFTIEMDFVGEEPEGITRGQTLQIRLALSNETTALVIPRGGFYQSTGGQWIFVVTGEGAIKRNVSIGRQNTDYFEVLSGLEPGEQVVVNSYATYGDASKLEIN